MTTAPLITGAPFAAGANETANRCFLTDFESIAPAFSTAQSDLLSWLVEAHLRAGGVERPVIEAMFERYSASADHIAARGHELEDFPHRQWDAMRLFGPKGSDLGQKTHFFAERVRSIFERF